MQTVGSILEAKNAPVLTIGPDATVVEAARLMNERHVGSLVVTEGPRVLGIFTERDVLNRVVAAQLEPARTRVREVMTSPVVVCEPAAKRSDCRALMTERRVRHLPVVDRGRLIGMISIGDLIKDEGREQAETIQHLYTYMHGEWPQPVGTA
ncbi:MAG: CBS domain-containing protein [Planctomycetes bacterium]|nr:CBS domain-containing protein [Planctomycetota bacterium]